MVRGEHSLEMYAPKLALMIWIVSGFEDPRIIGRGRGAFLSSSPS